ncbi:hypothetical protein SSS_02925 [Sarcoptes scabiei]|nr:hypothetical protein SSS_02925 [Sarcoptes scabiei]
MGSSVPNFKMFSIILVLVIVSTLSQVECQYTKAKNCSVDAFDTSFANAYGHFGLESLSLPTTQSKLKQYCKAVAANKIFSKDFGERCLTGTSQTLLNLQVYNVDRINKPYCGKNGKKKVKKLSFDGLHVAIQLNLRPKNVGIK